MAINSNAHTDLISQKIVEKFGKILAPLNAFSVNYSPSEAAKGARVKVPVVTTNNAVSAFTGEYVIPSGDLNAVDVYIDKIAYVPFQFSDLDAANSAFVTESIIDTHAEAYANKLASFVFADILSLVTPSNFTASVNTASGFGYNQISDLAASADGLDWPVTPRNLVLNSTLASTVRKDIKSFDFVGDASVVRKGTLGEIAGFETFSTPYVPTANSLKGFAAASDAIAIANRIVAPAKTGENVMEFKVFADPQTGISIGFKSFYDTYKAKQVSLLEVSYGYALVKGDSLIRLV